MDVEWVGLIVSVVGFVTAILAMKYSHDRLKDLPALTKDVKDLAKDVKEQGRQLDDTLRKPPRMRAV